MAMNKSAVCAFYFAVLQILWVFRLMYETIVSAKDNKSKYESTKEKTDSITGKDIDCLKRHKIHLFTSPPPNQRNRPICYMQVSEIMSPIEEEMLRCACAKGIPNSKCLGRFAKRKPMSRRSFTTAWLDSFTLA